MATSSVGNTAATELLALPSCAVFAIAEGSVTKVASGILTVLSIPSTAEHTTTAASSTATAPPMLMITCGNDFSYPLVNQPVLKSQARAYILPAEATLHYMISIDGSVSDVKAREFEQIITMHTQLRNREATTGAVVLDSSPRPAESPAAGKKSARSPVAGAVAEDATTTSTATVVGTYVSTGIIYTGKAVAQGAVVAAEYAGWGFRRGAAALTSYLSSADQLAQKEAEKHADDPAAAALASAETARNKASNSASLQTASSALTAAKWVSGAAVTVSTALVAGATALAQTLGAGLTESLKKSQYGDSFHKASESDTGKAIKSVALASFAAVGEIWDGLEKAAIIIGKEASTATHKVVEHRYGTEAGVVVSKGLDVAADLGVATLNLKRVGPGGLLKRTAIEGAKNVLVGTPEELKAQTTDAAHTLAAANVAAVNAVSQAAMRGSVPGERPQAGLLAAAAFGADTAVLLAACGTPSTQRAEESKRS